MAGAIAFIAIIPIVASMQLTSVALFPLPELLSHVTHPARIPLLAKVACEQLLCAVTKAIDLGTFERAVNFFL
jgi:hypothetical protein